MSTAKRYQVRHIAAGHTYYTSASMITAVLSQPVQIRMQIYGIRNAEALQLQSQLQLQQDRGKSAQAAQAPLDTVSPTLRLALCSTGLVPRQVCSVPPLTLPLDVV